MDGVLDELPLPRGVLAESLSVGVDVARISGVEVGKDDLAELLVHLLPNVAHLDAGACGGV